MNIQLLWLWLHFTFLHYSIRDFDVSAWAHCKLSPSPTIRDSKKLQRRLWSLKRFQGQKNKKCATSHLNPLRPDSPERHQSLLHARSPAPVRWEQDPGLERSGVHSENFYRPFLGLEGKSFIPFSFSLLTSSNVFMYNNWKYLLYVYWGQYGRGRGNASNLFTFIQVTLSFSSHCGLFRCC